jgi:anti-anti-sigma factor
MVQRRFRLHGEIDFVAAPEIEEQLLAFVNTTTSEVVLDCDGLKFIDSVAIAMLLSVRRVVRTQGRQMRVVSLRGIARHATDALGLTKTLTMSDLEPM